MFFLRAWNNTLQGKNKSDVRIWSILQDNNESKVVFNGETLTVTFLQNSIWKLKELSPTQK